MAKLWGGRFEDATDSLMEAFGESVSFDARLAPWDIRGSIAHARMLGDCGIISKADAKKIIQGLRSIAKEISDGTFEFETSQEDVHTNVESALVGKIGDAGKRLHTGRSRNDQVSLDMRLWTRDQIDAITDQLCDLRRALVAFAEDNEDVILPGCTHLQHAQPVLLAHHILAYFEMFSRDHERFSELRERVDVMPLGSAALAGTPYPINREQVAEELGFSKISTNSMDAVSDRDYLIEFCSASSLVMMHLSRLSEELILWTSPEFGFVVIGDAFTTGSSIMPQKKNPDAAELLRGKTGRVYGNLMSILTLMKGLPMTYNRDMQEDKPPVFDTSDTVQISLAVAAKMISSVHVNPEAMADAVKEGFLEATDMADYLCSKGVPFREAHGIVGKIVLYCSKKTKRLPELDLPELKKFSDLFESDILKLLSPESIVKRRDNIGGTSPRKVKSALRKAKRSLS